MSSLKAVIPIAVFVALSLPALAGVAFPGFASLDSERILLPVYFKGPVPGAFGSEWVMEVVGRNSADVPVWAGVTPPGPCGLPCPDWSRPANSSFVLPIGFDANVGVAVLYVDRPNGHRITLQARIRDLSRQAETWGTAVPVVRESDFKVGSVPLLNVPTGDGFRTALRIYSGTPGDVVRGTVRIYEPDTDTLLAEESLELRGGGATATNPPPYIFIHDLAARFPQIRVSPQVRVEFTAENPELTVWAFCSVTHNETQHVTIIAPE